MNHFYSVGKINKNANPEKFQACLVQLDEKDPGNPINPAVAEALAMPPKKRKWREQIIKSYLANQKPQE